MDSSKLTIKFFLASASSLELHAVAGLFQKWIQTRALPGHTTIDVADYAHVVNGPGILLTTHEANISTDAADGEPGLLYVRKRFLEGTFATRLRHIFGAAAFVAHRLEQDLPVMKFDGHRLLIGVNDRLLAPDNDQTFAAVESDVRSFLKSITPGAKIDLKRRASSGRIFEIQATLSGEATIAQWAAQLPQN